MFPAFPGGLPGIALLLFRGVLSVTLLLAARSYLDAGAPAAWLVGAAALAIGALLLVGFLTPIAGAAAVLGGIAVALSVLPPCAQAAFDSRLAIVLGGTMLVGVIALGPGAFSLDARLFGRREIVILPPGRLSHE